MVDRQEISQEISDFLRQTLGFPKAFFRRDFFEERSRKLWVKDKE